MNVENARPAVDGGSDSSSLPSRREVLQTAAVSGAGLMLTLPAAAGWTASQQAGAGSQEDGQATGEAGAPKPTTQRVDELRVAIIGAGSQGLNLLNNALKIPGIRFIAACDIWEYSQTYARNLLKKYDQPVGVYSDYRELLDKEKDLDAAIVATPDWVHAEQTLACLNAGLHVYCEKEMSNTLEGCRQMVRAARTSGKLLQIGHQRRSNPRYWHALKLIEKDKVCGRITHFQGQWNRAQPFELGWPKGKELSSEVLQKYGYDTMERFRNWRWYRRYSGGPMADLGSHQIDVFNWFFHAGPTGVLASGGRVYDDPREWYDNVLALYEYNVGGKPVRGSYQVLNSSSHGGFWEVFMGTEGTLMISEDPRKGFMFREPEAKRREWEDEAAKVETLGREAIELKIGETLAPDGTKDPEGQRLLAESKKPPHQLHLENFFNAIRTKGPLSCPPEVAYETAVAVLKANDAVEAGERVEFRPDEFKT